MRNISVVLLALTLLLTSCTSAKKRAAEQLEKNEFDQAIATYQGILKYKPTDPEALEGLTKARQGKISQQLIEVRRARMGGDPVSSANILLAVLALESSWKTGAAGPAAFTQNEEIEFSQQYLSGRIKQSVDSGQPLLARVTMARFQPILQKRADALKPAVDRKGKESCQKFASEVRSDSAAYADFVRRYCAIFGEKGVQSARLNDQRMATLFRSVKTDVAIEGLDDVMKLQANSHLATALQEALQATAWYDPNGKKTAQAKVAGAWNLRKTRETIDVDQPYTVSVPYQEEQTVTRTRQVPYTVVDHVYDPALGRMVDRQVTRYRDEPYSEQVLVQKHRDERRTYRYTANEYRQTMRAALSVAIDFNGHALNAESGGNADDKAIEHNENRPEYGLRPASAQLPVPLDWLKGKQTELADQFRRKAVELWVATYCSPINADAGVAAAGEQVHQCLRQDPNQAMIGKWYADYLGLRGEDVRPAFVLLGYAQP